MARTSKSDAQARDRLHARRRTGGGFALLFRFGETCGLIPGATACIEDVGIDTFRRDWSGFALVCEPRDDGWLYAMAGSFVLIAGYFAWRLRLGT